MADGIGSLLWGGFVRTVGGAQAVLGGTCVGGAVGVAAASDGLAAWPAYVVGTFCADQAQAGTRTFLSGEFKPTLTSQAATEGCEMAGLSPGKSSLCGLAADVTTGVGSVKVLGKLGSVAAAVPDAGILVTREAIAGDAVAEASLKQLAMKSWELEGPNQLVKVIPAGADASGVTGYITQLKFIAGKTVGEMEQILGLKPGMLGEGAQILKPNRLPNAGEFNLRGYTNTPGGAPFVPGSAWPPGLGSPQWQLGQGVQLPGELMGTVAPGQAFIP